MVYALSDRVYNFPSYCFLVLPSVNGGPSLLNYKTRVFLELLEFDLAPNSELKEFYLISDTYVIVVHRVYAMPDHRTHKSDIYRLTGRKEIYN